MQAGGDVRGRDEGALLRGVVRGWEGNVRRWGEGTMWGGEMRGRDEGARWGGEMRGQCDRRWGEVAMWGGEVRVCVEGWVDGGRRCSSMLEAPRSLSLQDMAVSFQLSTPVIVRLYLMSVRHPVTFVTNEPRTVKSRLLARVGTRRWKLTAIYRDTTGVVINELQSSRRNDRMHAMELWVQNGFQTADVDMTSPTKLPGSYIHGKTNVH